MKIFNFKFPNIRCVDYIKDDISCYKDIYKQNFKKMLNKKISFKYNDKINNFLLKLYSKLNNIIIVNYPITYTFYDKNIIGIIDIMNKNENTYEVYVIAKTSESKLLPGFINLCINNEFNIKDFNIHIVDIKKCIIKSYKSDDKLIDYFLNNKNNLQYCQGCLNECKTRRI